MSLPLTRIPHLLKPRLLTHLRPHLHPFTMPIPNPSHPLPSPKLPASMSNLSTKPRLHLYTSSTPNGYKPPILLEELIAAYPANTSLTYDFTHLSFDDKDQKTPQFLEINPNGRIPALVDDNTVGKDGKSHKVFESANILLWLVGQYDPEYKFWFQDPVEQSVALSWIFFAYGGECVAPWHYLTMDV